MGSRVQLQTLLEGLIYPNKVYFQPPESVKMSYPCIVYSYSSIDTKFADDLPYSHSNRYQVTVIDADPDSEILGKISGIPTCKFDRHYTADNLNHFTYNIYY